MNELIVNLHMHTNYSDGSGSHADIGQAALRKGVDVVLVTDHNILVMGMDAYFQAGKKKALLLACEEIHDQDREPQKNHLLVFNTHEELATLADDPQTLVSAVKRLGGLSFLAHPVDPAMPAFDQTDISWVEWDVRGFTGIELWNGFSELKTVARGKLEAIYYAFFPEALPHGPLSETLRIWDGLLEQGARIVAIGGSDAHALKLSMGPLHRTVFPYEYHFSSINTHILAASGLTGDLSSDREMIFESLEKGHCFVGCDLFAPTRGFRFSAQDNSKRAIMGDEIVKEGAVILQAKFPSRAEIHLIKDGKSIKHANGEALSYVTNESGVFRIEAYKTFLGKRRGWIFSNPIYVK
jgi:hypothetical protein